MTTTTTLITGANKGIGRETARRLLAAGHDVWIGARDVDRGLEAAEALGARFVQLDVTDDASVAAAVATVEAAGGLDVLINNAGIAGAHLSPQEARPADLQDVYDVNVFGVIRVTQAFAPLLARSPAPVIVNVSSALASISLAGDPDDVFHGFHSVGYSVTKAAVNMLTVHYAKAFPTFRVNAIDPGYTATDLNEHAGPQTLAEGSDAIVAAAQLTPDGPTGAYWNREGALPW